MAGGVGDVGLGPEGAGHVVDAAGIDGGDQAVADEGGALLVHEVEIAGPAGRDDGLAEQHRLGGDEAEALAAMQAQDDVRGAGEGVVVGGGEGLGEEADVREIGDGGGQLGKILGRRGGVADLQQEEAVGAVGEGGAEGGDRGERVLPHVARGDAEGDEDDDGVGRQAEGLAIERGGRGRGDGEGKGDDADAAGQEGGRGSGGEARGDPGLVDEARAELPGGRHRAELPVPEADHSAAAEQPAGLVEEDPGEHGRVDVEGEGGTLGRVRGRGRREVGGGAGPHRAGDVERPGGDAEMGERVAHQARAFAEARGAGELARDDEAGAGRGDGAIGARGEEAGGFGEHAPPAACRKEAPEPVREGQRRGQGARHARP